jgi:manganese transport protein
MLYIAMGILGATVMPHNLYLHSSIVQTRAWNANEEGKRPGDQIRDDRFDGGVVAGVLRQCRDHGRGGGRLPSCRTLRHRRHPLMPISFCRRCSAFRSPARLFALALLASGTASTLTATLAGQIVMEGLHPHPLTAMASPASVTRCLALVPALITIVYFGETSTGSLLVLSQVVLSLQLSFAVIPLVIFTSDPVRMGVFVNPKWLTALSWVVGIAIAGLNAWLLIQTFSTVFA